MTDNIDTALLILEDAYKKRLTKYKKATETSFLGNTARILRKELEEIANAFNELNDGSQPNIEFNESIQQ